jgi:hypothetical protein
MKKLFICVIALALTGWAHGADDELDYDEAYNVEVANGTGDLELVSVGPYLFTDNNTIRSGTIVKLAYSSLNNFYRAHKEDLIINVKEDRRNRMWTYVVNAPKDGWLVADANGVLDERINIYNVRSPNPAVNIARFGTAEPLNVTLIGFTEIQAGPELETAASPEFETAD